MQSLLRLGPRLVVRRHFVGIVVVDLVEGVSPGPKSFGFIVLQSCTSISVTAWRLNIKLRVTYLAFEVNGRGAYQVALIVGLLHRRRRRRLS